MAGKVPRAQYVSLVDQVITKKTEFRSITNEQDGDLRTTLALSIAFLSDLEELLGTNTLPFDEGEWAAAWTDKILDDFITATSAAGLPLTVVGFLNFLFLREFTPVDGGNGVIIVADIDELRALDTADEEEFPDGTPVFVTYSIPFHSIYDIPDQYTLQRGLGLAEETTFNTIVRPSDFATTSNNFVKTTNLPSNHRYGGPFYHDTIAQRDLWLTQHSNLHTGGSIAIITNEPATSGQKLPGAGTIFSSMDKVGNFLVVNKGNLVILDYATGSVVLNIASVDKVLAPVGNTHILYTTFDSATDTLKVHRVNLPALTVDTDLLSLTSVDSYHTQYVEGVLYLAINVTSGTSYVRAYAVPAFTTIGTLNLPASHFTDKLLLIKSGNYILAYTRTGGAGTETLRIINTTTLTQTKTIAGVYNPLAEMAASLNGVITLGADGNKFHKLDITGGDGSTYAITTLLNLGGDRFWDIKLNEAKTLAYVLINQLANGSGDQYLKKMDLATFTFVASITDNSILNRPYVLSEGEDKLYLSDNTGTTQVRSTSNLSLIKTIAGALGINNFTAESGKIYAGTVSSGKLYEIDPVTDEYIVTSPNGAYWLSKDKTFWNRIVGNSEQSIAGETKYIFEPAGDIAALKAIDVTTTPSSFPDKWLKYVESEQAAYALDRQSTSPDDSTKAKRYIRPNSVLNDALPVRWVRVSNIIRTFDTVPEVEAFLYGRREGEIAQVQKAYPETVYPVASGMDLVSVDFSQDGAKAIYLDRTSDSVKIVNLSTGAVISVTESGYEPYEGRISRFNANLAAVKWKNPGETLSKLILINLTTGAKTTVAGANTGISNGMDFSAAKLVISGPGENIQVVLLSDNTVTTIPLLHDIEPSHIEVSTLGTRATLFGGSIPKVVIVNLSDNSLDYADVQGAVNSIAWAYDSFFGGDEFIIVHTSDVDGASTVKCTPGNHSDFPVSNYPLPGLFVLNGGWYEQGLTAQPHYGNAWGFLPDLLIELNPYTGKLYSYQIPTPPQWGAWSQNGERFFYQDALNDIYCFDYTTRYTQYIGRSFTGVFGFYSDEAQDKLIIAGNSGGTKDVTILSGINVQENGQYQILGSVTRRIYPVKTFRNPIISLPNSTSGGDYGPEITSLQEQDSIFITQIESLQAQLLELNTAGLGLEPFPVQNGLNVGDLYYKTSDTVYVQASPATFGTAKTRGLVVGSSGGNLVGRLMGTTLTNSEIAAVSAAGVAINQAGTYYLAGTGTPDSVPPTTPGYQLKVVLRQGNLVDETPTEIGLEDFASAEVNTGGTDVIPEYASRYTVVGNSATPFARIPSEIGIPDGKIIKYINKGDGAMTITGTYSNVTDMVLAKWDSIELTMFDGDFYI